MRGQCKVTGRNSTKRCTQLPLIISGRRQLLDCGYCLNYLGGGNFHVKINVPVSLLTHQLSDPQVSVGTISTLPCGCRDVVFGCVCTRFLILSTVIRKMHSSHQTCNNTSSCAAMKTSLIKVVCILTMGHEGLSGQWCGGSSIWFLELFDVLCNCSIAAVGPKHSLYGVQTTSKIRIFMGFTISRLIKLMDNILGLLAPC